MVTRDAIATARWAGYDAGKAGKEPENNPYGNRPRALFDAWEKGRKVGKAKAARESRGIY